MRVAQARNSSHNITLEGAPSKLRLGGVFLSKAESSASEKFQLSRACAPSIATRFQREGKAIALENH